MNKQELASIIREEIIKALNENEKMINETYDLEQVKYSPSVRKHVDSLVDSLQKSPNLTKIQVASILNDIILALNLNRAELTMYMNMIKQSRNKYSF